MIYAAQGTNASFDFIQHISPCVDVFRHIIQTVESELLLRNRSGKHKLPTVVSDVTELVSRMKGAKVHRFTPGRTSRMNDVVDVFSAGVEKVIGNDGAAGKLGEFQTRIKDGMEAVMEMFDSERMDDTGSSPDAPPLDDDNPQKLSEMLEELLADFLEGDDEANIDFNGFNGSGGRDADNPLLDFD